MTIRCRSRRILVTALAALSAFMGAGATARAQAMSDGEALRQQIMSCFSLPDRTGGTALLSFELGPDGTLRNGPEVVSRSANDTFVAAARRAILRCAPYRTVVTGKVEVRFENDGAGEPDPGGARSRPGGPPAEAALPYPAPAGLCFVIPTRSRSESRLWNYMQPPNRRREIMETIAVDCAWLAGADDGSNRRPAVVAMVARTEEPPGVSETREAFLSRLAGRLEKESPVSPRFWEAPPIAGTPLVGRDAEAVYTANRQLDSQGRITVAALYGYTRIDGATRTFALVRFDGADIGPRSHEQISAWITAARAVAQRAPASVPPASR